MTASSPPPNPRRAASLLPSRSAPDRLDVALTRRGLTASRERAKAAVAAGLVRVNGTPATKPSQPVGPGDELRLLGETLRYVGRGGLKLERALEAFGLDVAGTTCVDIGASTGGFTDCLLQHGAARVTAVDVGHGQLHASLAVDARVTNLEGTDARTLAPGDAGGPFDVAVTDVSFISLAHVLPAMARLLRPGGTCVCLVKPQFEAGPAHVGKRGVVRDARVHREVLARVLADARAAGLEPRGLTHSPVTGGEGNIEYLLHAVRARAGQADAGTTDAGAALDVGAVVKAAHAVFGR